MSPDGPGEDGLEGSEIAGAHTWQLLYAQQTQFILKHSADGHAA